jgi:HEAT repeat protein
VTFENRLAALTDPDYLVRLRGVEALVPRDASTNVPTEPGDPSLVSPLLELADDPTKNVRAAVAWTLGIIASSERGAEAKSRIRSALEDPNWRIRFAAARAFNYLRDQPFGPLVELLDDHVESVRWAAASTLAWRKHPWYGREPIFEPSLVAPLVRALSDPAPTVRAAAIRGLQPQDGDEAFAALEAGLLDVDYRVRIWPSYTLRDSRAVPGLINVLNDQFLWVRANAVRNLGALRDRRAVEPLVAQLRTKDRYMRREAARALASIGDPDAIPELVALRDRSTLDWVKASATEAIETITRGP